MYLRDFPRQSAQLAIVSRTPKDGSETFFEKLKYVPLKIIGQVSKVKSEQNIQDLLYTTIPSYLQKDAFYRLWISDMAQISEMFCDINESDTIGFCLTSQRGCARYHVDNVPMRLLVTYAGQGTEWIPDTAADRRAFERGAPNEEIVKEMREIKGVHKIKPGITGLAQVNGRDSNSYDRKVELDYEYMKNANFMMDIKIVLKTFVVILFPRNIKH